MNDAPQGKGTRYVILQHLPDNDHWLPFGGITATSANAAIRDSAKGEGTYVAIPYRSWKPVKVTVETKQTVKLG